MILIKKVFYSMYKLCILPILMPIFLYRLFTKNSMLNIKWMAVEEIIYKMEEVEDDITFWISAPLLIAFHMLTLGLFIKDKNN